MSPENDNTEQSSTEEPVFPSNQVIHENLNVRGSDNSTEKWKSLNLIF